MLRTTKARLAASRRDAEQNEGGFTLIELMVVVLIIAILLAIAIPTFLGSQNKAKDRSAQSALRNTVTAAKTIYTDGQTNYDRRRLRHRVWKAAEPSLDVQRGEGTRRRPTPRPSRSTGTTVGVPTPLRSPGPLVPASTSRTPPPVPRRTDVHTRAPRLGLHGREGGDGYRVVHRPTAGEQPLRSRCSDSRNLREEAGPSGPRFLVCPLQDEAAVASTMGRVPKAGPAGRRRGGAVASRSSR